METVIETVEVKTAYTTETKPKPSSKPVVMPGELGLAEHRRNDWVLNVPPDRTVDELLEPSYWAHVAPELNPLDTIECRWEDGSRIVHLRVRFSEHNYARVKVTTIEELGSALAEVPDSGRLHKVEWKGPVLRFAVVRNWDKAIVQSKFKDRETAAKWLVEHEAS